MQVSSTLATVAPQRRNITPAAQPATEPELLLNASAAMPRLLDAVRGAQHVINISLYGWLDSGSGAQLARAIEQKAREGVEVNVMMDARGSFVIPGLNKGTAFAERLRAAGVNVIVNRSLIPFLSDPVDHGKSYSIDGRVGFLGGMNLSRTYDTWNDAMVTLDPAASHAVGRDFLARWVERGGTVSAINRRTYLDPASAPAATGNDVLVNRPGRSAAITDAYAGAIATAKQRLWIESPFLGSQAMVDALVGAARRGVDVRLLTNGIDTDGSVPGANWLGTGFYAQLVRGGVKVYQQDQMTHSKILLADDHAIVGSFNLTTRSERGHHEMSLRSTSTSLMGQVAAMFDAHMATGLLVTEAELRRPSFRMLQLLRGALRIQY